MLFFALGLSQILVVVPASVERGGQYAKSENAEGEYLGTWFEMPAKGFLVVGECNVRMNAAIEDGTVDVYDVGVLGWVFEEVIAGWEGAVGNDMIVRCDGGAEARKDDGIRDFLRFDLLLNRREDVRLVFESNHNDSLELRGYG